ncbi:hypothetical protein KQI82_09940 [Oscillibacter sp. MSJ-2]|uniref:DUF4129 domain-containing protein n=1 Tax=Dysosmobacter acutus TaxID=2841504 RepID=A0ABS6FAB1_9FIRM|nr:hypothetical protein [Dysosmobacter acutus]MBU5627227.1 hypothetical protein [Dysosmobacter acutus]
MREKHTLSALTTLFSSACIFCTLYYLMTLGERTPAAYYPQVLMIYAPVLYGLNRAFLHREHTMRSFTLLNVSMGTALFLSVLLSGGESGWVSLLFVGIICLWLTILGAQLAMEPPKLSYLILCLDLSLMLLVLFIGYLSLTGASTLWSLPIAAGCAAAILGIISHRTGSQMGARGWGIVALMFLVIFILVWLLVSFAAAPAGQGLVVLWNAAVAGVRFLADLMWKILLFLCSLIPMGGQGELSMEPGAVSLPQAAQESLEANPAMLIVLAVLCGALLLVLFVWVLRQLGKLRIGGKAARPAAAAPLRQRVSLWAGLRRLLAAWRRRLHLRIFLWRIRNMPAGVYYCLVRRCRSGPWRKKAGETPRDFLLRLQRGADPELYAALNDLIPAVDESLFGLSAPQPVPQARLIRRRVGTAVLRQAFKSFHVRIKELSSTHKTTSQSDPT